jgi:hypothetical protein
MSFLSLKAWGAALDAALALMDGGAIELLSEDGQVLARVPLGPDAFRPAADGEAKATALQPSQAILNGKATKFRGVTSSGESVIEGRVGSPLDVDAVQADILLNDRDLRVGGLVTILDWTVSSG